MVGDHIHSSNSIRSGSVESKATGASSNNDEVNNFGMSINATGNTTRNVIITRVPKVVDVIQLPNGQFRV